MNTVNNKRRQATREKLERVFVEHLQTREISQISVAELCKDTGINRSTFYANYLDIYDLADRLRTQLEQEVSALYDNDMYNNCASDYLKLFYHIRDNQIFYKTYFKLGYDNNTFDLGLLTPERMVFPAGDLEYHVEFHKAGLNAVIKKWLTGGCVEAPEAMAKIIEDEYRNRR